MQAPSDPPFSRSVAQYLEHPAWDREAAGENPAIPTIFKCCRSRNRRGIRLLNESMQVRVLPAAPFLNCQVVSKWHDGLVNRTVLVRVQPWQPIYGRQADISWLHLS